MPIVPDLTAQNVFLRDENDLFSPMKFVQPFGTRDDSPVCSEKPASNFSARADLQ
jgi:hypothetical protein